MAKETRRKFIRRGLELAAALIVPLGLEGCYSQKEDDFYSMLKKTSCLNEQEKGLAKRVYEYIGSKDYEENLKSEEFRIDPKFFDSSSYAKWGLGKKQGLSLRERAYVSEMERIVPIFEEYDAIDIKRLDEEEQEFLEKFHKKYGVNPVIESIVQKDKNLKDILEVVKILSGNEKITDKDAIILKRIENSYLSGIQGVISR